MARYGHSRLSKLAPIEGPMRFPIDFSLQHCAYLISFHRYNNLSVFRRFTHSSLVWSPRSESFPGTKSMKVGLKKPGVSPLVKTARFYGCHSWRITIMWRTYRQTDRHMDTPLTCIPKSCCSVGERDKNDVDRCVRNKTLLEFVKTDTNQRRRFNPLIATLKPQSNGRTIILEYSDWYTGRWWAGCYIWYSEEGTGRGPSPPRPLLVVPNVTAQINGHCNNVSFDLAYNCFWSLKG